MNPEKMLDIALAATFICAVVAFGLFWYLLDLTFGVAEMNLETLVDILFGCLVAVIVTVAGWIGFDLGDGE